MKNFILPAFLCVCLVAKAQGPVDTTEVVLVGGIKQFITLKGKNNTKPLLLFLHGGPGNSVIGYADRFSGKLQEHFIVIQWDQREAGKTLAMNSSPVPLTLSLFENDTHELIEILLRKFNREKLYLAGHSWGTALGFYIAGNYPELLYAYLPVSPMINQVESERIVLEMMKEKALKAGDDLQIKELASIKIPFESGDDLYYHRKGLFDFIGSRNKFTKEYILSWASTWLPVFNEASRINRMESLPSINCPVYFFTGNEDYQTNYTITEKYYNALNAPKKEIFLFDNTAHSLPYAKGDLLQKIIIEKILPATYPR
jgi:pimeloyl-ACP methyl ester carboxylesterase